MLTTQKKSMSHVVGNIKHHELVTGWYRHVPHAPHLYGLMYLTKPTSNFFVVGIKQAMIV